MKQKILRSDVAHIINDWKSGLLTNPPDKLDGRKNLTCWLVNHGPNLQVGSTVALSSLSALGTIYSAIDNYVAGDIILDRKTNGTTGDPVGFCVDPINANSTGRITIPSAFGALVVFQEGDDDKNYADLATEIEQDGLTTPYLECKTTGAYRIIARSQVDYSILEDGVGVMFCVLIPLAGEAQEPFGHILHTLTSTVVGPNQTVSVTINGETVNVKCPMLASAQIIPVGTIVAIDYNQDTEEWEIISSFAQGHMTGTTSQQIEGPIQTTGVVVNAGLVSTTVVATCPLLHNQEVLDAQTPVIVSWNYWRRAWEIIEAQCPSS